MIISKARLSRSRSAQGSLAKVLMTGANADRGHGLVWALFNDGVSEKRNFLYRETEPGSFIIVSEQAPNDPHGLWTLEHKPYEAQVLTGDRLGFVLRANPVLAVPQPGKLRGLRADAIMHAKSKLSPVERLAFTVQDARSIAVAWLAKRGPFLGFDVDTNATSADGYQQIRVPRTGRQPAIVRSTMPTPRLGSPTSLPASPITPPAGSMSCCRGTGKRPSRSAKRPEHECQQLWSWPDAYRRARPQHAPWQEFP